MRPIKLKISGLNSYIDEQVIDFEKLTERGLFGIFGQTGSGKSTILDAMTIAMYGNIPRNTKEFINSACDRASISYEFEIGGQNTRRRYIVDRTIKRTKTGGILTSHCRLVEIHNDSQSTVLADKATDVNKKIAEVVGLTVDDFTRSVVLPQGKFNDFLKLTESPFQFGTVIWPVLIGIVLVWGISWFICYKGVKGGIEKLNKVLLPTLIAIMVIIVV